MSLQNLQAELAEAILANDPATTIVLPVEHLRIYQNNIESNLVKTLKNTYPLITKLLGDDFFQTTACHYIAYYPSRSGNLHDYGEYFSDFLAEHPPVKHLCYLAEVALFEWSCHTLFVAADHAALDIALLEKMLPEQYHQIHFILHPACRLMAFQYPIMDIIDLCKGEQNETVHLDKGGIHLLIIRRELEIALAPLTAAEFAFLAALQEDKSLSQAFETALSIEPDFKLEEKLPGWVQDKTLVDCYVENT